MDCLRSWSINRNAKAFSGIIVQCRCQGCSKSLLGHTAKLIAVTALMVLPAWTLILAGRCGEDSAGEASSLAGLATGLAVSLPSVLLLFRLDSTRLSIDRAFLIPAIEFGSLPATREIRAEGGYERPRRSLVRTNPPQTNAFLAGMPKTWLQAASVAAGGSGRTAAGRQQGCGMMGQHGR